MSSFTDEDREVIALHLAALRRHGWAAAKALGLVAQGMPAGDAQRELEAVSAALERGDRPDPAQDPFLALLAQGEAAGPEALLESVRGSRLATAARRAWRQAAIILSGIAVGFSVAGIVGVTVVRAWLPNLSPLAMPAPTRLLFELTSTVGYFGPALVLAVGALPWLVPEQWLPGVRKYRAASRLRQFAAALAANVPAEAATRLADPTGPAHIFASPGLELSRLDRKLGELLLSRDGPASSAQTLAHELQAEAALSCARFAAWAPVVGLAGIVSVVVPVVVALYLPIFTLAGAIK